MSREATAANSRERQLTGHDLNELYEPRSGGSNDEGPQLEFCQLWSAGIHHRFHFSISPRLFEGSSTNCTFWHLGYVSALHCVRQDFVGGVQQCLTNGKMTLKNLQNRASQHGHAGSRTEIVKTSQHNSMSRCFSAPIFGASMRRVWDIW